MARRVHEQLGQTFHQHEQRMQEDLRQQKQTMQEALQPSPEDRVDVPKTVLPSPPVPSPRTSSYSEAAVSNQHNALGRGLVNAAMVGNVDEVRRLLNRGANINFPDSFGMTPVMNAVSFSHVDVVTLLLEKGADVHPRDDLGRTALHIAVLRDRSDRCTVGLISAGANVNSKTNSGDTPLHFAAWRNEAAVRALLAAGADKTCRNNAGSTPYDLSLGGDVGDLLRPSVDMKKRHV